MHQQGYQERPCGVEPVVCGLKERAFFAPEETLVHWLNSEIIVQVFRNLKHLARER